VPALALADYTGAAGRVLTISAKSARRTFADPHHATPSFAGRKYAVGSALCLETIGVTLTKYTNGILAGGFSAHGNTVFSRNASNDCCHLSVSSSLSTNLLPRGSGFPVPAASHSGLLVD
jgi:hypothetical protein